MAKPAGPGGPQNMEAGAKIASTDASDPKTAKPAATPAPAARGRAGADDKRVAKPAKSPDRHPKERR